MSEQKSKLSEPRKLKLKDWRELSNPVHVRMVEMMLQYRKQQRLQEQKDQERPPLKPAS